jgi:ribosomal protein S18 acetylase RimI-like enzyme
MKVQEPLIVEMFPSAADYNRLRVAVGWKPYREEVIADSLPNSLYCLCALIDGQTVGMARIIGDGGMVYYIQDVIVLPEYQRRGIGTHMMDLVMEYLRTHSHRNTIIGLMAAAGKEAFYEKYGFTRRPNDKLGAGMTLFWQGE